MYLQEAHSGVCASSSLLSPPRQESMKKERWGWLWSFQSLSHSEDKEFHTPTDCSSSLCIFHLAYEKCLWATTRMQALRVQSPQSVQSHFRSWGWEWVSCGLEVHDRSVFPGPWYSSNNGIKAVVGKYITRMGDHHGQGTTTHYCKWAELQYFKGGKHRPGLCYLLAALLNSRLCV